MFKGVINKKVVFEFLSISFAVFLGLFLNQLKENFNNKNLAKQSINNIRIEFSENKAKIEKMLISQEKLLSKIDTFIVISTENDTTIDANLFFQFTNSSSWETARLTQSVMYMDVKLVQELSEIYKLQSFYEKIVEQYTMEAIHLNYKISDKDKLLQTKQLLKSIIPIEKNLIDAYNFSLEKLLII